MIITASLCLARGNLILKTMRSDLPTFNFFYKLQILEGKILESITRHIYFLVTPQHLSISSPMPFSETIRAKVAENLLVCTSSIESKVDPVPRSRVAHSFKSRCLREDLGCWMLNYIVASTHRVRKYIYGVLSFIWMDCTYWLWQTMKSRCPAMTMATPLNATGRISIAVTVKNSPIAKGALLYSVYSATARS